MRTFPTSEHALATAHAAVHRRIELTAPPPAVWPHVDSVEDVVGLMESLHGHESLGDDAHRFTLRRYHALGHDFVPEAKLRLTWHPLERLDFDPVAESRDHARAHGVLRLLPGPVGGTIATLEADVRLELPIPRLLARPAAAVLAHELRQGFDRFLQRLRAAVDD